MKAVLVASFLAVGALSAEAQVGVGVSGGSWGSSGSGWGIGWGGGGSSWGGSWGGGWSCGPGYGWGGGSLGYGYGYGWGYGGSYIVAGDGYGLYYSGPVYGWSGGGSAVAPGVAAADPTPGWGPWGAYGPYRRAWTAPVPSYSIPPRAAARAPEAALPAGALEEGRRRFRLADYRGALDGFREAVVADGSDGAAEAHFALALAATGDHRNADKALRSALGHGFAGKVDVASMAKDERERGKLAAALLRSPETSLASAWALSALGRPERLDALSAKDADAKRLAGTPAR